MNAGGKVKHGGIAKIPKNVLLVAGLILLVSIAMGGAIVNQQIGGTPSQSRNQTSGGPDVSSAPLQMRYFDLNSVPLTLQNSDEVYMLNQNAITSTLASDDDDINQLNQLNSQADSQGL